ncbi:MAG: hypothetical protein WC089_02720 [Candidatus Paceibacterota bacterium]
MITLDLVEFIEKEEKNGTPREKIKSELLSAGWLAEDIEEGFQKVAPAFVVPKMVEPVAPKIQTTFTPAFSTPPAEPKADIVVPAEIKTPESEKMPEVKTVESVQILEPSTSEKPATQIVKNIEPQISVAPIVEPTPVSAPAPDIVLTPEVKIDSNIEPETPKIDPYREVVKEDKPIENSFSASVPPSNLPKVWTPSNIPIISSENTEVIPRLIPKKVEPVVSPKAVLPPVRTPERKAELAKVYQKPSVAPVEDNIVPPAMSAPIAMSTVPASSSAPMPGVSTPAPVSTLASPAVEINPTPTVSVPPVVNIAPATSAPSGKPPYMVFAKQELSKPVTSPVSMPVSAPAPYSPNSAVTSSFPRDSKNFVFEEKKPGVPRFIVGVFIFVAIACIFGGVAFAYTTGLIDIPFLPKINQTAVTAKYIDPIINEQNSNQQNNTNLELNNVTNSFVFDESGQTEGSGGVDVLVPPNSAVDIEALKIKDKNIEENISNIELQIYKKYALNKNLYGTKSNLKGSCVDPEKDSLFYTDPNDMNTNTISFFLGKIFDNTDGEGSCYSTTKAWAMSFPLASETGSYVCVDSTNKKITTKIALSGTVCK